MEYTIILKVTFANSWLALSRDERKAFETEHVQPIFAKYHDRVRGRFYDSEAFDARFSDFIILTTSDLKYYFFLIEELRDSAILADGHVAFDDVVLGIENGHAYFEREALGQETVVK